MPGSLPQDGAATAKAREKLEESLGNEAKKRGRRKSDLLFHYTDEFGARGIIGCMCISKAPFFNHPDGIKRPAGAYATELMPWHASFTQSALRNVLWYKPRKRPVSHYVAILKERLWERRTGVEWVKKVPLVAGGPTGTAISVNAIGFRANLMQSK